MNRQTGFLYLSLKDLICSVTQANRQPKSTSDQSRVKPVFVLYLFYPEEKNRLWEIEYLNVDRQ